ncbi:hypothetical protein ACIGNX_01100 [Actinosynnema sp. NPDC053489]|uniref:hypothetical protein n=1 Tax=Actinosynnema sp. NPDC053489 TaxID=3363916 RepID=UPI0037CC5BC5
MRLALALPYAALSWELGRRGFAPAQNAVLEQRAAAVRWGATDLGFLDRTYPPLPVAVAALLPGGAVALGVAGAVAAGMLLHLVVERLVQRRVHVVVLVPLVLAVAVAPGFLLLQTGDFAAFTGLALLAVAIEGFTRFAFSGETHGGFQAGLALGSATLCDPVALVYAGALAGAAPLMAWYRYGGVPAATRATAAVILFPGVAAALGWVFLQWRFTGHVVSPWQGNSPPGWDDALPRLVATLRAVGGDVATAPIYVLCGVMLAARRPLALTGYLLPVVGLVAVLWLGLRYSHVEAAVLLALVGVMSVPLRPGRRVLVLLAAAAALKLGIEWTLAWDDPVLRDWTTLTGGVVVVWR